MNPHPSSSGSTRDTLVVEVERVVSGGKGLARLPSGKIVLIDQVLPGERVRIRIVRNRRDYAEAVPDQILTPSPDRTSPPCSHFPQCGGCYWQDVQYRKQLELKRAIVEDAFHRTGKLGNLEIPPVLPSPRTEGYRNKMEFSVQEIHGKPVVGLHPRYRWDTVLPIDICRIVPEPMNEFRNAFAQLLERYGIPPYHPHLHRGLVRTLMLRCTRAGKFMVVVSVAEKSEDLVQLLRTELKPLFPEFVSWYLAINPGKSDALTQSHVLFEHLWGEPYLEEEMSGIRFRIGPRTFFQTNLYQAERLFSTVLSAADPQPDDGMLDLYCGAGTFALLFAPHVPYVIGVEIVEEAIAYARMNAEINGITNAQFYAGDVGKILPRLAQQGLRPNLVLVDPARPGLTRRVIQILRRMHPRKIVYVSCNPVTQARDCTALMAENLYRIRYIQPVDMFPHSPHVENIVVLER